MARRARETPKGNQAQSAWLRVRLPGMIFDVRLAPSERQVLGSSLECDIALRARLVSRRHVELWQEEKAVHFRDLGSTNGTYLDEQLAAEGVLAPGSVLRIGEAAIQLVDSATATGGITQLPETLRLVNMATLDAKQEAYGTEPNRRYFTIEDVAHLVASFLAEGRMGQEWAMLCRFLREALGCLSVVCYEQEGEEFVLRAGDGPFPSDVFPPDHAQQVAALSAMGTFLHKSAHGQHILVSLPVPFDHRRVCFLGVALEGTDPLLHHQELLPVLFVLCRLVLHWAVELRDRDDAVGAMKARIREVEAGLAGSVDALEPIVGNSPILLREIETVSQVAPTDLAVLVCGPTGAGKELFARRIHRLSRRSAGPFVPINCASIPENLLESELFGVERGAFTGADRSRTGFFEKAAGGTLFLDEIADLPLGLQPKLLRVLEEKQVAPLGSTKTRPVDVRVVAATNQKPLEMIAKGRFREDLYYRLAGVVIHVPPLRERGEDVLLLANYFLHVANREFGKKVRGFDEKSVHVLRRYAWPGNVRQLQALVKQLVLMSTGPILDQAQVETVLARYHPDGMRAPTDAWHLSWEEACEAFEEEYFRRRLASHLGSVTHLAKDVGITRPNLYLKMKKWGLKPGKE